MNSMERAPEPTMEEILASIRRIIADDESGSARQQRDAPPAQLVEELEASEGEADDKIISDIARVLSENAQTPQEEEEDILDLTSELGGMEIVEEQVVLEEVAAEPQPSAEIVAPEAFQPAPASHEAEVEAVLEPEVEAVLEPIMDPVMEPEARAAEPEPAPAPMSASEEAASALERAIAALRAGQLPTSFAELTTPPQPVPQAETPIYDAASDFSAPDPEPAPAFEPEAAPQAEAEPEAELRAGQLPTSFAELTTPPQPVPQAETPSYDAASDFSAPDPEPAPACEPEAAPQAEAEPEAELVLAEFETVAIAAEPLAEQTAVASETDAPPAWESETAPWAEASEPLLEPEGEAAPLTNGHSAEASGGAPKSLEDSVKDMLRPMLQRWLDENMTRVLTAALQDELRNNPARFQRD